MSGQLLYHPPIAVDFWKLRDCSHVRLFFLSHMHSDHTEGLTPSWSRPIYCSPVTRLLLLDKFKLNPQQVHGLDLNDVHCLRLSEDSDESLSVTLIDANHCPGAVMFLFEGYFGRILYTGDFRYSQLLNGEASFARACSTAVDKLYLDNTFCSPRCDFPSREKSMAEILRIISEHPNHRVMIGLRKLGKEGLLVAIAKHFRTRVFVTKERLHRLELLRVPNVFTTVESEARISVVDQGLIHERNVNQWNEEMPTISIVPTALYRVLNISKALNRGDVFVVPYSDHSSFSELCEFVATVRPRTVIPILTSVKDRLGKTIPERADMSCFEEYLDESPSVPFSPPFDFTVVKQDVVRSRNRVAVDGSNAAGVKSKKFKFKNVGRPMGVVYEHHSADEQSQNSASLTGNCVSACNKAARTNEKELGNSEGVTTVEGNGFTGKKIVADEDNQEICVAESANVKKQKNIHIQSEREEAFSNVKSCETLDGFESCQTGSELALTAGPSDEFDDGRKQGECDSMKLVEKVAVEYAESCDICEAHSDVTFPMGSSHECENGLHVDCMECSSKKLAAKVVKGRADGFNTCQPGFVQSVPSELSNECEGVLKCKQSSSSLLGIENNDVDSYSLVANTGVSQLPSSSSDFILSQNDNLFKSQCSENDEEVMVQVGHEQLKLSDLILESLQPIFADEAQNMFDYYLRAQNKH